MKRKNKGENKNSGEIFIAFKDAINVALEGDVFQKTSKKQLRKCLNQGVDINCFMGEYGATALMLAVKNSKKKLVTFLIENGANVNARDLYGFTPLHSHIDKLRDYKKFDVSIFKELLKHGADFQAASTITKETPLSWLAQFGTAKLMKIAIQYIADINKKDAVGCTPLAQAIFHRRLDLAMILCDSGALLTNIDNYTKGSAFHLAVGLSKEFIEKLMIHTTITPYNQQEDEQLRKSIKTILCAFNRIGFPKEIQHRILLELSSDCLCGFNMKLCKKLIDFDNQYLFILVDKRIKYLKTILQNVNKKRQTAADLMLTYQNQYPEYITQVKDLLNGQQLTKDMEAFHLAFPKIDKLDQNNLALRIGKKVEEKIGIGL